MEFIAAVLIATALAGGVMARWTRTHPLLVGVLVAIPAGVLGLLVAAGAMSPAAIGFGAIAWLVAAAVGSFGAFVGWLRRQAIARSRL